MALKPVLEEAKEKFQLAVESHHLGGEAVQVTIGTLSVEQAIGNPNRQDFPLIEGKEVMIEAQFKGGAGQAFTNRPHDFAGSLDDVLGLSLRLKDNRAIFVATINAVMAYLGMATGVRHCRDEEPEECGSQIARYILGKWGGVKVGLIGLQSAILESLVLTFGRDNVRCTDLNPKNTGSSKRGVEIWDGQTETEKLIRWCDLLLVTSSTIVNNTFDSIRTEAASRGKPVVIFGVTGAGISALLGLDRVCFKAHQ